MPDGAYELMQCSEALKDDEIVWCASDDEGNFQQPEINHMHFY